MTIYYIIQEDDDVYIEPHKAPVQKEDIEIEGKRIVTYKLTQAEAEMALKLQRAAS